MNLHLNQSICNLFWIYLIPLAHGSISGFLLWSVVLYLSAITTQFSLLYLYDRSSSSLIQHLSLLVFSPQDWNICHFIYLLAFLIMIRKAFLYNIIWIISWLSERNSTVVRYITQTFYILKHLSLHLFNSLWI